jgi:two-component system sensor histidine kinase CpxA
MRIFARSLLSFWVSTLLTLGLAGLLLVSTGAGRDEQTRLIPFEYLQTCARTIVDGLSQYGAPRLGWESGTIANCPIPYLFGPDRNQLAGNAPTSDISLLMERQAQDRQAVLIRNTPDATVVAFELPRPEGPYRVVAVLPSSHKGFPAFFWLHLLSAIAVSGLIFWLLARQFSQPILSLRLVAEGVANGNLSIRPSRELLDRKDEIGELARSIDIMFGRIDDLMSSQKDFLAQVSHELGSPLTRLNLALALARRKATPELAPELERLEYEARELNSMIQQLLLLARLENDTELDHAASRFSLAELVSEVADDGRFEARQSAKTVSLRYADEARWLQVDIIGYRDLLKRAIDNVLRNAIRFTAEGGVIEITFSVATPSCARLCVRDYGPGVPDEQLGAIFEPFVRMADAGASSGAGLGLAIAKRAVLTHGGAVSACNADPRGLSITIDLPLASQAQDPKPAAPSALYRPRDRSRSPLAVS